MPMAPASGPWCFVALIAGFVGWHLIAAIGGADMPVVISMLNSYSGWAAAAIGFTLSNNLLIVTGRWSALRVRSSHIMCRAMNRNFVSVILGGFGTTTGPAPEIEGEMVAIDSDGVAAMLDDAGSVIIVPLRRWRWPGAAVGQRAGAPAAGQEQEVRFGIHPVAGRLPGHMNVLLAGRRCPTTSCSRWTRSTRFPQHRRLDRHRVERHRQPGGAGGSELADRRDARARSLEGQACAGAEARPGTGYSGIENPLFCQGRTPGCSMAMPRSRSTSC